MTNNWQNIWSKRKSNIFDYKSNDDLLLDLIKLNGFDTGYGDYNVTNWRGMVQDFIRRSKLKPNNSIFEIGCGSGAFLYAIKEQLDVTASGIDYSEALIEIAKKYIKGNFTYAEASQINSRAEKYDVILSHGVFFYFPSLDYSYLVIEKAKKMLNSKGRLVLMDMCDKSKEKKYHVERAKYFKDIREYNEKYKGLPHLFFEKNELTFKLKEQGFNKIEFFDHYDKNYKNKEYRFNLIASLN